MVAQEILSKGIQFEGLRDEIFVQIIKQITNNPNPESATQLWHLLQLCVLHFPPTPVFENYLEAWLRFKGGDSRTYIIRSLHCTQEDGVIKQIPPPEAIEGLIKMPYPASKEPIDVYRPQLLPPTAIEEVVAINQNRAVGASGPRPTMKAGPQSSKPPPVQQALKLPIPAAKEPVQEVPPNSSRPMPTVPGGPRPLPTITGKGPPSN